MKNFYFKYKPHIITFTISMVFGVGVFLLYFYLKGAHFIDAINASSVVGIVLIGGGLLVILTRLGAFDTFVYSFKQLFSSMFAKEANRHNSMADYKLQKYDERKTKKRTYLAIFLAGLIFFFAAIILMVILEIMH